MKKPEGSMAKHSMKLARRLAVVLAAAPLFQASSCTQIDLQSALTVGVANFAVTQFTVAADTIFRNLLGA